MGWSAEHEWLVWLLLAGVFVGVEIATLSLVALMLAAGALAGAVAAAFGAPVVVEALSASVVALLMLVVVRPVALGHLRQPVAQRTGVAALVGHEAVVLERVDGQHGLVRIGGEVWSARSYDRTVALEPGATVDVIAIDGATAVVYGSGA